MEPEYGRNEFFSDREQPVAAADVQQLVISDALRFGPARRDENRGPERAERNGAFDLGGDVDFCGDAEALLRMLERGDRLCVVEVAAQTHEADGERSQPHRDTEQEHAGYGFGPGDGELERRGSTRRGLG